MISTTEMLMVGTFGGWGYSMAVESNGGKPLDALEDVVILPAEKGQEDRFWTVDRQGRRIPQSLRHQSPARCGKNAARSLAPAGAGHPR